MVDDSRHETFVIAGASLAGATAAAALREEGFSGRIVLVGEEHERPYERPPLSKDYLQGRSERDKIFVHPADWYAQHDAELQLGTRVTRVDAGAHELTVADGKLIRYDKLLLCTGSSPRPLPVPGAEVDGVLYLRTVGDSERIMEMLASVSRVAVVGAGWIGLEVTADARNAGVDVTLLEMMAIGFAAWLSVHAVHIQNERIATLDDLHWIAPASVPDETLEPSNVFGLVTLLCVPAVLLIATRSTSDHRRRVGRRAAFAGLLGAAFIVLTTTDLLPRTRLAVLGPEGTSTGPAPSLHDTGLTQAIAVALVAAVVWHVVRRPRSRSLTVAFAMTLPALGYAIGTLVTPMAFRPGWSRTENLALNLLEVAFVAAVVATFAARAIASLRRPQNTPRVASGENGRPRQNPV